MPLVYDPKHNLRPPPVDDLTQLRFLLTYLFQGCEAPFMAYVEASREPGLDLILLLTTIQFDDMIKTMLKPSGLRTGRHGRKGRKSKGGLAGIGDPLDGFAEIIHAELPQDGFNYSTGTRTLYVISEYWDRAVWTAFLVSGITEFGYDTIWGVIQDDRSQCANLGRFMGENFGGTYGGAGPLWKAYGYLNKRYAVGCTSSNGFHVFVPDGRWVITLATTLHPTHDDVTVGTRIIDSAAPHEVQDEVTRSNVGIGERVSLLNTATVTGPFTVAWTISVDDGFVIVDNAHFSALKVVI